MKISFLPVLGLCLFLTNHAFSQSSVTVVKITKDSIAIKWLPNNFEQFKSMLTENVSIKKMEVEKNASVEQLDFSSVNAISIDNGKKNYERLENELWFQESFELLLSPYFDENLEATQKNYAFALALVANLTKPKFQHICGNIFVDKDFDKKRKYAYEITAGGESFRVIVDPSQITKYKAVDFELSLDKKKTVDVIWKSKEYNQDYFGFQLKKSIGNKNGFSYLKKEAYLPFRSNFEKEGTADFVRDDSLVEGEYHYYTIYGIDLFGQEQASDIIKKIYVPKLTNAWIEIEKIEADGFDRNIKTIIHPTGAVSDIHLEKLHLYRSKERGSGYELIEATDYVNNDTVVKLVAEVPLKTGDAYYYKIIGFNEDNDSVSSLPFYFFTLDQEPPSPVVSLEGKIDSLGVVDLKWEAPEDNDLRGYRVFRANARHEEFTEKTKRLSLQLSFKDTLALDNLTPEVYYFIVSVDSNFNNSIPSDTILVLKPDTIAPIPAVLKGVIKKDSIVFVEWINSTSSDLNFQALIRTNPKNNKVDTILQWSDSTSTFKDPTALAGNYNTYQIITWDKSLNHSISNDFEIFFEPGFRPSLKKFIVEADRNKNEIILKWEKPTSEVFSYKIYKGKSKDKLSLFRTIENSNENSFTDIDISINNQYFYAIKYITKDGIHSIPAHKTIVY